MTQAETLIALLLGAIVYLLYQILKQLTFLTGRRYKFGFPKISFPTSLPKRKAEEKKLPN